MSYAGQYLARILLLPGLPTGGDALVQLYGLLRWSEIKLLPQSLYAGLILPNGEMALSLGKVALHEPAVGFLAATVQGKDLAAEGDRRGVLALPHIVLAQAVGYLHIGGLEPLPLRLGPVFIRVLFEVIAFIESLCDAVFFHGGRTLPGSFELLAASRVLFEFLKVHPDWHVRIEQVGIILEQNVWQVRPSLPKRPSQRVDSLMQVAAGRFGIGFRPKDDPSEHP